MSQHLLEEIKAIIEISTYTTGPVNSKCDSLKMLMIKSDSNKKSETNQMNILIAKTYGNLEDLNNMNKSLNGERKMQKKALIKQKNVKNA